MQLGVSIIICCYNSEQRLPETLKHLALQKVPSNIPWEIILVNNASTDNTVAASKAAWQKYSLLNVGFSIADQPIPGLNRAREKGISEAKYEYLIFCDDDNWLCENYVAAAYNIMEKHTDVGLAGGFGKAVCEITPPDWFKGKKGGYAVSNGDEPTGDVTVNGHLCGAGMVLRKSVIQSFYEAGFRSLLTDRNGTALSSGGDAEISKWHILAEYKLWCDAALQFEHFIPKERLTETYVTKLWAGFKTSAPIEIAYNQFIIFQNELKKKGRGKLLFQNVRMAGMAFIYQSKYRSTFSLYAQNIKLCLNGIIQYDKSLYMVQKMLTRPLQQIRNRQVKV